MPCQELKRSAELRFGAVRLLCGVLRLVVVRDRLEACPTETRVELHERAESEVGAPTDGEMRFEREIMKCVPK